MIAIVEQQHGDVTRLALQGDLVVEVEKQMAARSEELVAQGKTRVVLDLAGIKYVDSSGIGTLVSLFKKMRLLEGDVKLASLTGQPLQIFRLLRLDKAFEVYDTPELAIEAFKPAQSR
jgi:anti-sigma B factor antagonist